MLTSECVQAWIDATGPNPRQQTHLRRFVEYVGGADVLEITSKQLEGFVTWLADAPSGSRLPIRMRSASIAELSALRAKWLAIKPRNTSSETWPKISHSAIAAHMSSVAAFITWASRQQIIAENPLQQIGFDLKITRVSARPFTLGELKLVLATSQQKWKPNTELWWLVRLALYSGAPIEELCRLPRASVQTVEGNLRLSVLSSSFFEGGRRIANSVRHQRVIPLHRHFTKFRFEDWAYRGHNSRIFTFPRVDENFGTRPAAALRTFLRRDCGLADNTVNIFSFRRTLEEALIASGSNSSVTSFLLGRPSPKRVLTPPFEELFKAIERLELGW